MALITVIQAEKQLRLSGAEYDFDIEMKMEQATALVITYLKRPDHGWTEDTDPTEVPEFAIVQAAILEVLTNLFADRGDREKPTDGPLTERVKRMLSMHRDPALA